MHSVVKDCFIFAQFCLHCRWMVLLPQAEIGYQQQEFLASSVLTDSIDSLPKVPVSCPWQRWAIQKSALHSFLSVYPSKLFVPFSIILNVVFGLLVLPFSVTAAYGQKRRLEPLAGRAVKRLCRQRLHPAPCLLDRSL